MITKITRRSKDQSIGDFSPMINKVANFSEDGERVLDNLRSAFTHLSCYQLPIHLKQF